MMITNKINLDLQKPGTTPTIHAVQNDSYSRNLEIALFSNHRIFSFPENAAVVIRYKKSDGKGGEYDTLPDGNIAWQADRNILTVALAPQVLTTPGSVFLTVSLIADGTQLTLFPIRLSVDPVAAAKMAKSEDYFYVTGLLPAPVSGKVGQLLRIAAVNDRDRITAMEAVDSHTPQKGIDYWTDADKESIVQDVINALGTPVFGTVDENNNIVLTGALADGTYTLKYEDDDGNLITIGTLEHTAGYTNQIPISTDTDGSIYNDGQGWKTDCRLNSSGLVAALEGMEVTGFIPIRYGDTVYLKNVGYTPGRGNITQSYIFCYDSNKNPLGYCISDRFASLYNPIMDSDGYLIQFSADETTFFDDRHGDISNMAYFRLNCESITNESIITVNEPIV